MSDALNDDQTDEYAPGKLEPRMQQAWLQTGVDRVPVRDSRPTRYVLGMFPYPSGKAHLGHVLVYTISDSIARLGRYKGYRVLHPLGWDAFGLPAENAAIQNNVRPDTWTALNVQRMHEQLRVLGYSFDLDREINSSSPDFYRWTQFLFLKLYEAGLVYRSESWVNWDPVDKTVLANEQVIDGKGWRSGATIERRLMAQWYIRITAFAEDLWRGLDHLHGWSERAVSAQRNWIGRSEGANIQFKLVGAEGSIQVFTSRAETLMGVTALVLSPEHPRLEELCSPERVASVREYVKQALLKAEVERQAMEAASGVATGAHAIHPITGEHVPVYVGDYVIGSYGTGAVMCVPGHDTRDFAFATSTSLPIKRVIAGRDGESDDLPFVTPGIMCNSGKYDGLDVPAAREAIVADLSAKGLGKQTVNFRLRDWSISRQRIWGAPIPMELDERGQWHPVPYADLPVLLPLREEYKPGERVQARSASGRALEADTMDTFMCSAWYAWRFLDARNDKQPWSPELANEWMPLDYYVGGLEHATQHMIYFRFMAHFLHSIGLTPTKEPVRNFLDNGLIRLGGHKMSKSRGNVVAPEEVVQQFGADALRLYVVSDAPFERDKEWDDEGLKSKHKFLRSIWALLGALPPSGAGMDPDFLDKGRLDDWGIAIVAQAYRALQELDLAVDKLRSFHVAVAQVHTMFSVLSKAKGEAADPAHAYAFSYAVAQFLKMLSVFCPHIADGLWQRLHPHAGSIFTRRWPEIDHDIIQAAEAVVMVGVTVNGKRRAEIAANRKATDVALQELALAALEERTANWRQTNSASRFVIVRESSGAPKVVNIVASSVS